MRTAVACVFSLCVAFYVGAFIPHVSMVAAGAGPPRITPIRNGSLTMAEEGVEQKAASRAARLKEAIESFQLEIAYDGEESKPFYRVTLSVAPVERTPHEKLSFHLKARITEDTAIKLIDYLSTEDWFMRYAYPIPPDGDLPSLPWYMQNYVVTVSAGNLRLWQCWGWGPIMQRRLKGLRSTLDGDAGKAMDLLLRRIPRSP